MHSIVERREERLKLSGTWLVYICGGCSVSPMDFGRGNIVTSLSRSSVLEFEMLML